MEGKRYCLCFFSISSLVMTNPDFLSAAAILLYEIDFFINTQELLSCYHRSQVSTLLSNSARSAYVCPGFLWNAADAYLFDIDGTLLNSRDPVHYFAFRNAVKDVFGIEAKIDGVPVHGNTDIGILRAVLQRAGIADAQIDARLPQMIEQMCAEVERNQEQMRPELCPSMHELVSGLHAQGKLLGAASGNLELIGWLKIEKAGLRKLF